MPRFKKLALSGWGRVGPQECDVARPERTRELRDIVASREGARTLIARGLGRSYGDSSVNPSGVVLNTRLNRMLGFDEASGELDCEAGVTLAEIIDVFLPRGFFLPVSPGTKFVTVGGAIAADVHGKNHHKVGSFGNFVREIRMLSADGQITSCSPQQNPQLFWATVGGMGLTGMILSARFQLMRVPSAYVAVDYLQAENLDAALEAFSAGDQRYEFSVAWIDCLASGASLGRSVLMRGNSALPGELSADARRAPLVQPHKRAKNMPFNMPGFVLNRASVGAFNSLYYSQHTNGRKIVPIDPFFYPLDSITNWNRLYGKRGFIQYQAFFPRETSRAGLVDLLGKVAESGRASFLAVLKSCGAAGEGVLSFLRPGHTLALDMPNSPGIRELHAEMDRIVLKHGGRLYLAKDAYMDRAVFREMYPELARFQQIKREIDPNGVFASAQARRVGIVGDEA